MPTIFFSETAALPSAQNGWCSIKETVIQYYPHSSVFGQCLISHSSPALEPETSSQAFSCCPPRRSESASSAHSHNPRDFTEGELRGRAINRGVWQQRLAPGSREGYSCAAGELREGSRGAEPATKITRAGPRHGRNGRKIKKKLLWQHISTEAPKEQPHLGGKLHPYVMFWEIKELTAPITLKPTPEQHHWTWLRETKCLQ